MRNWIIFICLFIFIGWIGFYYAHYIIESVNYVATWGQSMFLAKPIMSPIPLLPGWANIFIGMIVGLTTGNICMTIKTIIKKSRGGY